MEKKDEAEFVGGPVIIQKTENVDPIAIEKLNLMRDTWNDLDRRIYGKLLGFVTLCPFERDPGSSPDSPIKVQIKAIIDPGFMEAVGEKAREQVFMAISKAFQSISERQGTAEKAQ